MTAGFFEWLIERSWQASLLAILIPLVQFALWRWAPARWRHAMWLPLLGLLIFPSLPESRVSVFNYVNDELFVWQAPVVVAEENPAPDFVLPAELPIVPQDSAPWKTDWMGIAWMAWAVGAGSLLGVLLWTSAGFLYGSRRFPAVDDPRLGRLMNACRTELGMRREVRMVQMPGREGPAVTGIFRPLLLLPLGFAETFSDREARLVFLHELAHWRRGDVLVNLLLAVLHALHWFNPVLWWAFRRIRLDRELACDEWVLAKCGGRECRTYGETLLKLSTDFEPTNAAAGAAGIFESRGELKRRIRRIAGFSAEARRRSLAGGLAVLALAATFLTGAVTKNAPVDPSLGKVVDRNGVLLVEYRWRPDGRTDEAYPLGAFAAHLLKNLDPKMKPKAGEVLYLTIDARVQAAAEQALRKVGRGAAVVLEPDTGDILAMASVPSFDPNAFFPAIPMADWKSLCEDETSPLLNRAITAYAPGAAYLPVTALAGIRAGIEDRKFACNGGIAYGDRYMQCWISSQDVHGQRGSHGLLNLEEGLKYACGPFFFQYANEAGIEHMMAVGKRLGIGQRTGLPAVGESPGTLGGPENLAKVNPKETWGPGHTANMAIGQGMMQATPLQLAAVSAALANGGTCYVPGLVYRVVRENGAFDHKEPAKIRARLFEEGISPEGIERVRRAMWGLVNDPDGRARKARLSIGGPLAGQTGTSQNWRRDASGKTTAESIAFFMAFAPYEKPRYAICVAVQGAKSGGGVAAPLAGRIIEDIEKSGASEKLEPFKPAIGNLTLVGSIEK